MRRVRTEQTSEDVAGDSVGGVGVPQPLREFGGEGEEDEGDEHEGERVHCAIQSGRQQHRHEDRTVQRHRTKHTHTHTQND